ncbi:MAG: sugar phosphate isomerase/epimerase [Chitinophagaceae bacterium]|nr:sugar phosphate isomerase/epimerase [Chitinophagaceae bacterium]
MKILFFCPRWGSEDLSWDEFCHKVKEAGYNGVEAGVSFDEKEKTEQRTALEKYNLFFIGQYWHSFEKDFDQHLSSYIKHLHNIASMQPIEIDSQTGKDYFSAAQNIQLFETAKKFTDETGIPVAHETHRNKALFAAPVAKHYLSQNPDLPITADFSHWCNVSESYLQDQPEAMGIAIQHTLHIHARVGHPQGAQVIDPRLPEWDVALNYHLDWWRQIKEHHAQQQIPLLTVTPEFGPAPYMIHHPVTNEPLADQWEINCWMMEYLKREL